MVGRQLDPLVDKILVTGTLIYLLTIPGSGIYPWMAIIVVSRELVIQWLRSLIEGKGEAFGAKLAGKLKTFTQCLAIVLSLLVLSLGQATVGALPLARDVVLLLAVFLTVYSGYSYLLLGYRYFKGLT